MASQNGYTKSALALREALYNDPYHFGFYAALRTLECCHSDRARLGYSLRPGEDKIRLSQKADMRFAPSTLDDCFQNKNNHDVVSVLFLGLFGPNGPLPLHLTEYARQRERQFKDAGFIDFLDLFHHRLLSLFYRAWADKEPAISLDRPEQDRFQRYIGSLIGVGGQEYFNRDKMPDFSKLHFAAHLGMQNHHADGLQAILNHLFSVPVVIQEFVGEWLNIPEDSFCYMDDSDMTGQLGVSAVIGERSWQCQYKFRISIGPLDLSEYQQLLPGGDRLNQLAAVVRNYLGDELNWDVHLILKKEQVPSVALGVFGQLGWTSWVDKKERKKHADDLYLTIGSALQC